MQVELGNGKGLDQFKIAGKQRKGASADFPKKIEIQGSTDKNAWETIETVDNITQTAGEAWESQAITANKKYPYLKFVVTTGTNRIYFHMAKFDLFKLTSTVEVKSAYNNLVTNEEATAAYDYMVYAQHLCNNPGTAEELKTVHDALKSSYETLKAKISNEKGVFLPVALSNVGENSWATLYAPVALSIPENVAAYTGELNDECLTLKSIEGGTIPANTAVILKGTKDAGVQYFIVTATDVTIKANSLRGTATNIETSSVTDGVVYTLQSENHSVVFKQFTGSTLAAGKAYLVLAELARSISIRFGDAETTDVESSTLSPQPSTEVYDLMGRRVQNPTKGMYIVNGKKVVIK